MMEQFCCDIINNICLDHENEIIKDITEGLEDLVQQFVKDMARRFPEFKVKRVTRCGSMAEKTRIIGYGLEYDYIVELVSWPNCGELCFKSSCEGSMQPLYMVANQEYVSLKTCVLMTFFNNLCKSIEDCCKESFCPKFNLFDCSVLTNLIMPDRNKTPVVCQKCGVYKNTGCLGFEKFDRKFQFVWYPKSAISFLKLAYVSRKPSFQHYNYSDNKIYVDIHPVLIVSPERILQTHSEENRLKESNDFYLFPNNKTNHRECCNGGIACWRISQYHTELKMLQETSQAHRNMFMILKYIREELFHQSIGDMFRVGAYEVKTAALHHIKNCSLFEPDTGKCLLDTIKLLGQCLKETKLTQIGSEVNILNLCTPYQEGFKNKFEPRDPTGYKINGLVFQTLYDLLATGKDTRTEELLKDFDMIHNIVGFVFCKADTLSREEALQTYKRANSLQIQRCQEVLKNYVGERTENTATFVLHKNYTINSRLIRLDKIKIRDGKKVDNKIDKEITHLQSIIFYNIFPHRRTFLSYKPKLLKGCYI